MAKLTKEQEQAVRKWADEGANLNEIQSRLKSEHDVTLTYFDARMLVVDLGLKLQEKKRDTPAEEKKEPAPSAPPMHETATDLSEDGAIEPEVMPPQGQPGAGKATVIVDQIAIPGTMASGKVTFSDGKTASWYVDQMGRLGLQAPEQGYKPPTADIPVFQRELDLALQRAGF